MICEKCKKEHNGTFGSGRFCSRSCANSRVFTEETNQKKRISAIHWSVKLQQEDPVKWAAYREQQRTNGKKRAKQLSKDMKLKSKAKSWDELGKDGKRTRVIDEQKSRCNHCGLSHWRNEPLVLEIEHKDGNHMNDNRDNLEALCPNCHSLTHTWRGKNKDLSKQGKISDEVLLQALKATKTIRQALIVVGLSPRGKNYVRAKKLLGDTL